jgi:exopolysaccharide production protein ExoQ
VRRVTWREVYAFVTLFTLFTGDGMRDLLSWWGFGALSALLLAIAIGVLVKERRRLKHLLVRSTALPLLTFVGVCLASVLWSEYSVLTLIGSFVQLVTAAVGVALVLLLPLRRLAGVLAWTVHANLALSLVFEAVVALLPEHRLAPFFTDYGSNAPGAYYWSQGLLFTGQRIQGVVGNANLTCFLALLGGILVCCLLAAHAIPRRLAVPALALDLLLAALTRSGTVIIAGGVVLAVALLVLAYRRVSKPLRRVVTGAALAVIVLAALSSSRVSEPVLRILGKGDDLTGRYEIWHIVGTLVAERPLLGWGWISYWAPWVSPYNDLVVRGGVEYLQAHNAYFDVQLQVGVLGLAAFAVLVGSVVLRALRLAVVRAPLATLPILLVTALLAQGMAESRLLIEGNWALLAALAVVLPWGHRSSPPPPAAHWMSPERGLKLRQPAP